MSPIEQKALVCLAAETERTAPKGEYAARTMLAAPSDGDMRAVRAIVEFASINRDALLREADDWRHNAYSRAYFRELAAALEPDA